MRIEEYKFEDAIELKVEGRVDTNTSSELQKKILEAFQKRVHVILDFQDVDYISSAGLRAILIAQRTATAKGGSLKLLHVSEYVMHVFDMSGFSEILTFG